MISFNSFYILVCPTPTTGQGGLQSYNYPSSYPGNINCLWRLRAATNYLVKFNTIESDVRLSPDCKDKCNFLAAYDGPSITDTKLGYYKKGGVCLVSSSTQLLIRFKTYKKGYGGFRGSYEFIHKSEGKYHLTKFISNFFHQYNDINFNFYH